MPWCPECRSEYEEGVAECAECHVPLVESREEAVAMRPLLKVKREDLDQLIAYLDYSGITRRQTIEEEDGVLVMVARDQLSEAVDYVKVYARDQLAEEASEEDYYFDAYETEDLDAEAKADEMKKSAAALYILGGGLLALAALNFLGIISLAMFNKTVLTLAATALGIGFLAMGAHSRSRAAGILESGAGKKDAVEDMARDFIDSGRAARLKSRLAAKTEAMDEGAAYFAVLDAIREELAKSHPEAPPARINAAAEKVYDSTFHN